MNTASTVLSAALNLQLEGCHYRRLSALDKDEVWQEIAREENKQTDKEEGKMADNMTWTTEQKQVIDLRAQKPCLSQRQQEAERRQYSYSEL